MLILSGDPAGTLKFRFELIKALAVDGQRVLVSGERASQQVKAEYRAIGAHYIDSPLSRASLNPLKDARYLIFLFFLILRERPNKILTFTIKPNLYTGIILSAFNEFKFYPTFTGLGYIFGNLTLGQRVMKLFISKTLKLAMKRADRVFFHNHDDLSEFLHQRIISIEKKVHVLPGSGVDLDQFSFRLPTSNQSLRFLMVSRLLIDKGVREYIAASQIVGEIYPGVEFKLVGSSDNNPMSLTESEIGDVNRDGRVQILGHVEDVSNLLESADVFVFPSYREGRPRVVLEAMAKGRPVITTDTVGCRETVVDGESGFFVSIGSVDDLVDRMIFFIRNPDAVKEFGVKARLHAESNFDVHRVVSETIRLLD